MIITEKFKKEHLDSVCELERLCFSNPWSRRDLESQINSDTSFFLVAVENGRVTGYMGLQIFSGEGYVTNVAVHPDFRRRGTAAALISQQLKNKMDFITLEVRESNAPAVSLYEKFGFEKIGVRPNFYTAPEENAIIMTKVLKNQ